MSSPPSSGADPLTQDLSALTRERTGGAGAAVAFEVSGSAPGLTAAIGALAVRGRLCLVGIHAAPREIDLHPFFWRELELLGARLYERGDVEEAVRLVAAGEPPVADLVSHVLPLSRVDEAFAALAEGGAVKVLVDCRAAESEA